MINRRQRRSPRLQGYDYAGTGAYFVTICTHNRLHLFGQVVGGEMVLSPMGRIAHDELTHVPAHWHGAAQVDAFVIMPNHVHAIIVLVGVTSLPSAASSNTPPDAHRRVPTLGVVVGAFKSVVTRRIRDMQRGDEVPIWQGRYHDHIIRGEADLAVIRTYIANNPARWSQDTFFS